MTRTKVVHSESKPAWNVIGTIPGQRHKVARCPYNIVDGKEMEAFNTREKNNGLDRTLFISKCFNDSDIEL